MANCKSKGDSGVRQFSECDQESNYTNGQICCFAYGTNADGTSFRGCISMNLTMFQNRTLTYNSDTISGTVVCDKNYNYDNYLKYSFFSCHTYTLLKFYYKFYKFILIIFNYNINYDYDYI